MTKKQPVQRTNKKHMARAQREQMQSRWLLGGTIAIAVVVIGILVFGWVNSTYVEPNKTVAEVNGEIINVGEFQGRVRILQRELLGQLNSYLQMEQFFASDPQTLDSIQNLENQIRTQLAYPEIIGQSALDSLIREAVIREEAERMGISVQPIEVEREIQNSFGFYPDGTPTPIPTFIPDETREAEVPTPPEPTTGPSPTATLVSTPVPTATPYLLEAYEDDYQAFLDSLADFDIKEADFLAYIEAQLLEDKVREQFQPEIETVEEQVLLQHIFTLDEEAALEAMEKLESGEAWEDVVLEYSQDPSTSESAGELGWFTLNELTSFIGQMGITVFTTPVTEVVGPVQSQQGWQIFRVADRQDREISEAAYEQAVDNAYQAWIFELIEESEITVVDDWQQYIPPSGPLGI